MARFCWEIRGCEGPENNWDHCPHYQVGAVCAKDCHFSFCNRPTHRFTDDWDLLLDPGVDRAAAIKEGCYTCEFFLKNGPRTPEGRQADEG